MTTCLVALGSNIGDRADTLAAAVAAVRQIASTEVCGVSRWQATTAVGGPQGQEEFLNGALRADTRLTPLGLLAELRAIEDQFGRQRSERWGARTLDLDLLLFGEQRIDEPSLQIPHPRMTYRPFVMGPAVEVAGGVRHPDLDATLAEILRTLVDGGDAIRVVGAAAARAEVVAVLQANGIAADGAAERGDATLLGVGDRASDSARPKLQILADAAASPTTATPAVWWSKIPAEDRHAEVSSAIECVWPGRGSV